MFQPRQDIAQKALIRPSMSVFVCMLGAEGMMEDVRWARGMGDLLFTDANKTFEVVILKAR